MIVQVGLDCVPSSGGSTRIMKEFHRALGAPVISFTDPALLSAGVDDAGWVHHVPVSRAPVARGYRWATRTARRRAEQLASTADLIIIHLLYRHHVQWAWRMAQDAGARTWIVPHGALDPWVLSYGSRQKRTWLSLIGLPIMAKADSVIFATEREKEKAAAVVGGDNRRVVHWPVPIADDSGSTVSRAEARASLGLPAEGRLLLSLSRLHAMKRIVETIDAVRAARVPDLHLLVVGPEEGISMSELAAHAGGDPRILILGPQYGEKKDLCYRAADGFVSLSHRENFGFAVAEALAFGLPVLLSPGNDLAADVKEADCGWFLQSMRPAEEAEAVRAFGHTPEAQLRSMGERGRQWAKDNLRFDEFRTRLERLRLQGEGD